MRLVHDREIEAVHTLPVQPLPARQGASSGPRTFCWPIGSSGSSRSTREAYVANTTTGPEPAHRASWIRLVVVRTPSCSRTASFSSEHTAIMGAVWPTRRHAWAVCTSRSRVGTMTRIRPSRKFSRAAEAAVIVLPDPVADTTVPRSPWTGTGDLAGNPTHFLMREFASTWCSRSWIQVIDRPFRLCRAVRCFLEFAVWFFWSRGQARPHTNLE